jgi:phytoene dehydrogenase-like protein
VVYEGNCNWWWHKWFGGCNYLQRNGYAVTMLEKKTSVGGACTSDTITFDGKSYGYSDGASVFGFMQDFVFEETDLAKRVIVGAPEHPQVVYGPCFLHDDIQQLKQELKTKWNETGDVEAFFDDLDKVRNFLIANFRNATVPTVASACNELGQPVVQEFSYS